MSPVIRGTVVVSIRYDEWGQAVAKLCSTYDEQGNLVDVVDLLAVEQQQALTAAETTSSGPRIESGVTGVEAEVLDGGMTAMSIPTAW